MLRGLLFLPCVSAFVALSSTTLSFPGVPFDLGIRHIHTPEHFSTAHGLVWPDFTVLSTSRPIRSGEYALMTFRFHTLFGERSARIFTKDKCESHLIFQDEHDRAYLLSTLRVRRDGMSGHKLQISGMLFREPTLLEKLHGMVTVTREGVQDAILIGYGVQDEDVNLRTYRRMVLFGVND
jgi:hypothetical protein